MGVSKCRYDDFVSDKSGLDKICGPSFADLDINVNVLFSLLHRGQYKWCDALGDGKESEMLK